VFGFGKQNFQNNLFHFVQTSINYVASALSLGNIFYCVICEIATTFVPNFFECIENMCFGTVYWRATCAAVGVSCNQMNSHRLTNH